ncbi:Protein of unknown function DUF820 [uncultured Microcoleus sp.]|uniref:Putative restriction endonuclease domain-containing protein n=1 Tax=uncultured Microcoleus sp. TaxID=259945 RepID=A0A6J4MI48_9CYAN|nr:Protein of unknown function DUF820 [uncultured Microcoleus sp.]
MLTARLLRIKSSIKQIYLIVSELKKIFRILCIEVVISSGSPIKLQKYREMGVPEVWFWEDGTLEVYALREQGYAGIASSEILPELDLSLLKRCILFASPLDALEEFTRGMGDREN